MPWIPQFSPVIVTLFAVTGVHAAVSMSFFVRYRHSFPINARKMGLVLAGVAGILMWEAGSMFNSLVNWPCPAILVTLQYGIMLAGSALLLRGWWVWFAYFSACEKVKLSQNPKDPKWSARWFQNHRHWISTPSILRAIFLITFVEYIPVSVAFYFATLAADYDPLETLCPALNLSTFILTITTGIKACFGAYTAFRIRHAKDGFYIKKELAILTVIAVLSLISGNVNRGLETNPHHIRPILWFSRNIMLVVTLDVPVYLAYRAQKSLDMANLYSVHPSTNQSQETQEEFPLSAAAPQPSQAGGRYPQNSYTINLRDVMNNPQAAVLFRDHLVTEFSAENFLFYEDVKKFEARCEKEDGFASMQEKNVAAAEICAEYIVPDSPSQVNLPGRVQRETLESFDRCIEDFEPLAFLRQREEQPQNKCLQPVPDDIFESARRQIFALMEKDSFQRFRSVARKKLKECGTELVQVAEV